MHPPDLQSDPFDQQEALAQLAALGYIEAPTGDAQKMIQVATVEAQFNLATAHMDAGQFAKAAAVLEKLCAQSPGDSRSQVALARCYVSLGRMREARALIDAYSGNAGATSRGTIQCDLLLALVEYAEGNVDASLQRLLRVDQAQPRSPDVQCQIGTAYARLRRWADAERAFKNALEADADNAAAQFGAGVAAYYQRRLEEAVERLLRAVGLLHYFPRAHFMLGVALARLGWYDRAVKAFEVTLLLRPGMPIAHRYLAALYGKLNDPERSLMHRRRAQMLIEGARAAAALA
jgi:tetratricopeptide (TPR) repeat protein